MEATVSTQYDDRDPRDHTQHSIVFTIVPEQTEADIVVMAGGIHLRLDADPARVGQAVLAYLTTARRLALDDGRDR
jgi:hypothetical protein